MDTKRLEIYVGWTCNQKCTYCMEAKNMERDWDIRVTKYDILKKLITYKKQWYNHVTYLWWEPFIQPVFLDALKIGKLLNYTILVTTNCTTLHLDKQASKFLPYIDELMLSVEAIWIEEQQKISRTKNYVHWDGVFENIKKYWKWSYLKANIVITQDNKNILMDIVTFLYTKWVTNIAITYPDIYLDYYWKSHSQNIIAPSYQECMSEIIWILEFGDMNWIFIKVVDFPFCVFPKDNLIDKYIRITDDYDFQARIKIENDETILDRWALKTQDELPRQRTHCYKCKKCTYVWMCWGPSEHYEKLYSLDEINPII